MTDPLAVDALLEQLQARVARLEAAVAALNDAHTGQAALVAAELVEEMLNEDT